MDFVDDHFETTNDTMMTTFSDTVTIEGGSTVPTSLGYGFGGDIEASLLI
jgi:hypothetical protein